MSEVVDERTGRFRIYGSFYIAFGVAALFLALVGLYGVVSFTVSQQTREIGVRIALGANQNDVVWSVLKFGALHVMWGVVAGVGMAFWISRGLASVLFQVETWDAPAIAGVALVLIFTSLAACAFPALRASRIAPVIAMRHQ